MEIALPNRLRFGAFELDVRSGELASGRHRIVLQEQPLRVLLMLVGGAGKLVTREEIQGRLWPNDTVVEFDAGINAAVRRLRQVLDDSAENPKYIETVARRGYRLMVPVEWPSPASGDSSAGISLEGSAAPASPLDARLGEVHLVLGTESSDAGSGEAVAAAPLRGAAFAGKKVSHYRVLEMLGGGGMGVVYEAEDLRLGRRVALKFLPEEVAGDERALERFAREARAASALNHPNICTIYEVEEHEGQPFIVMELLEGETLSKRIGRAPLPLDETLDAAIQICAGLGAAHGKGIIHRDIKPSNIFITTEGVAKILDFGLAKLQGTGAQGQWPAEEEGVAGQALPPASGSAAPDLVPDAAPDLTLTGAAMGTVPYMSPEQVRGEKLDSRTDLFSFGAVLYEMTTVRQAFTGHSAAAIRDAILHQTPPPVGRANPASSPELQRIIGKAMEKDRALRCRRAEELGADLKRLKRSASSDSQSVAGWVKRNKKASIALMASGMLVAATLVYTLHRAASRAPAPLAALEFTRVTSSGDLRAADISPDGKYLSYVREMGGKQSLWMMQLATGSEIQITTLGEDQCPGLAFSPDGSYVYFVRQNPLKSSGDLYQVPSLGGSPRKILAGIAGPPAFSPDGQRVAFVRDTPSDSSLLTASLNGSGERVLASYKMPESFGLDRVTWSSDGNTLAFLDAAPKDVLTTIPAEGGPTQAVAAQHWNGYLLDFAGLPGSRSLVVAGVLQGGTATPIAQLYEVWLEGGEVRQITSDLSSYTGVRVSADAKTLLALQDLVLRAIQVVTPGQEAEPRSMSNGGGNSDGAKGLAWTPDGKIVYFSYANGRADVWEMGSDGSNPHRLTNNHDASSQSDNPAVSLRDGFIAFRYMDGENGKYSIWRMDMDGSNQKQLTWGKTDVLPSVSPDGRWIVFDSSQGGKMVLMKIPSEGGPASQLTDYESLYPAISPNGKWIACVYFPGQNQSNSLAMVPFEGGQPARLFPLPVSAFQSIVRSLGWTPDGQAISFVNTVNGADNIWEQPVAGGPPKPVTHFTSGQISWFNWSRDGRLALSRGSQRTDAVLIRNFQ
jgi:serine/threonine protein kinase/Tol biopolymer transport system component/DNA-binding winged helix-turn-helix (wHTH) protein